MTTFVRENPLDLLRHGAEPPLAAVFLSYTFDPVFFEHELLAALLPLMADPEDNLQAFLAEGTRKLQEIPVLVMADSGHVRTGRRLPYDLLLASERRTFHPKLSLLLHRDRALLVVGSGNLTTGGYGGNAESGAVLVIDYAEDGHLLWDVVDFLEKCGVRGEAWGRILETLDPLSRRPSGRREGLPRFLHTFSGRPLLDQFLDGLPNDATVRSVGLLAPFHQEDGASPERAVMDRIVDSLEKRCTGKLVLDVGLSWERNPVSSTNHETVDIEAGLGQLWGIEEGSGGKEQTLWFVLGKREDRSRACDHGSMVQQRSTRELHQGIHDGKIWPVGSVEVAGPGSLVERVSGRSDLSLFVHPEFRKRDGQVVGQPLHAKLLAVALSVGRERITHLLVGSPNASARALLDSGGNVECAVHLEIPGHHRLPTLCPDLVPCPAMLVSWRDLEFPAPQRNPVSFIEDAWHDPVRQVLAVTIRDKAPVLKLCYPRPNASSQQLFFGKVSGRMEKFFQPFELHPGMLELVVEAEGAEGRYPIRIVQVHELPSGTDKREWALEDVVGLYAGRSAVQLLSGRTSHGQDSGDDAGGGDGCVPLSGLPPRDVFRALFAMASEVTSPDLSPGAFRLLLEGQAGLLHLAKLLVESARNGKLLPAEAWIYGQELLRELAAGDMGSSPFGAQRKQRLNSFSEELRRELEQFEPPPHLRKPLFDFYRGRD